ncbi:MAG: radical SAM protein [Planctomycetota bacterium]
MHYEGHVIRPPSEAESLILQVSVGCSHNACSFCGTYRGVRFHPTASARIAADLDWAATHHPHTRRVFLCDGDPTALPTDRLLWILASIRRRLPQVERIACYASAHSVARKSDAELTELRAAGLRMAYLGLESGDDAVLATVNKGCDARTQITQARRLIDAGCKLSLTVLLGLGGRERWREHASATGAAVSAIDPAHVAALTLMPLPGTPLAEAIAEGRFALPGPQEILAELRELLAAIDLTRGLFLADHASNYLPLRIRLPRHKADALARIDAALAGALPLRPERWRGL